MSVKTGMQRDRRFVKNNTVRVILYSSDIFFLAKIKTQLITWPRNWEKSANALSWRRRTRHGINSRNVQRNISEKTTSNNHTRFISWKPTWMGCCYRNDSMLERTCHFFAAAQLLQETDQPDLAAEPRHMATGHVMLHASYCSDDCLNVEQRTLPVIVWRTRLGIPPSGFAGGFGVWQWCIVGTVIE